MKADDPHTGLSIRFIREWKPRTSVGCEDLVPFSCRWFGHLWTPDGSDDATTTEYCTICGLSKTSVKG